jgi:hypothetical protein
LKKALIERVLGAELILIAVVDGLKGLPDAIASVYPQTVVQTSIVHARPSPATVEGISPTRYSSRYKG